jgi:precorrin-2 dehydrogenase/sirohydrochlorin ferrochelatase
MGYMVNLSLQGRAALVVGGGEIGRRKVMDLLAAQAGVTVVAPRICDGLLALAAEGRIAIHQRSYQADDIANAFIAIAATNDTDVNTEVFRDASVRNVLVNVVDVPALCTFTVPATVRRGDLTIAIATDGRCPAFASILREELEQHYGPEYGDLVGQFAEARREMIAAKFDGPSIRARLAELYAIFSRKSMLLKSRSERI